MILWFNDFNRKNNCIVIKQFWYCCLYFKLLALTNSVILCKTILLYDGIQIGSNTIQFYKIREYGRCTSIHGSSRNRGMTENQLLEIEQ